MSTSFGSAEETGDDFIDSFQIPVRFAGPYVEHTRRKTDVSRGLRNVLCVEKWARGKELGRGGFGTVYLETEGNGSVRAVKEVPKRTGRTKTMDHLREVLAMAHFSKQEAFFVTLQGWYQSSSHIYIAMEYFPNGDLCNCVSTALAEEEVRIIAHQLTEALESMHQRKFTHRDLKPSNVFVVTKGPRWWVKLGDFGVSKRVKNDSTSMHTSIETDYTAPEITGHLNLEDEASCYTDAVDMWSLGCLIHWLLTGQLPLSRRNLMLYCMQKIPFPREYLDAHRSSEMAHDFILKVLQPHPRDRMSAGDALSHEWPQDLSSDITMEVALDVPLDSYHLSASAFENFRNHGNSVSRGKQAVVDGLVESNTPMSTTSRLVTGALENPGIDQEAYYKQRDATGDRPSQLKYFLDGVGIEPVVLNRKINQMLGSDAGFVPAAQGEGYGYWYWGNTQFTENQVHDLKHLSIPHGRSDTLRPRVERKRLGAPKVLPKKKLLSTGLSKTVTGSVSISSTHAKPPEMNEYFLPALGIDRFVLTRNSSGNFGYEYTFKPFVHEGVDGYLIYAPRPFTQETIQLLKIESSSAKSSLEFSSHLSNGGTQRDRQDTGNGSDSGLGTHPLNPYKENNERDRQSIEHGSDTYRVPGSNF